jgi:uncharacterized protein
MSRSLTDPARLGTVEDVSGSRLSVKLDDATAHGLMFVRGEGYRVGQVGSFVRIPAGYVDLFGIVVQVGAGAAPGPPDTAAQLGSRWLRVELVGEGRRGRKFERGISQYPSIGDAVHVVTETDLRSVYAPSDAESHVPIGRVASAEGIRAYVDLNRLVTRHCAVVGSTGAGKSTAVASLLSAISNRDKFPAARVVLLDLHGEYAKAFGDRATVFKIGADKARGERELYVPFWALTADEFIAVSMGVLSGTPLALAQDWILQSRRASKPSGNSHGIPEADITIDTPLPFSVRELWLHLYSVQCANHTVSPQSNQTDATRAYQQEGAPPQNAVGDSDHLIRPKFLPVDQSAGANPKVYTGQYSGQTRTHLDGLEVRLRDPRMKFLFQPGDWSVKKDSSTTADLDTLLASWLGSERPISVFDLSGIPKVVLDDLVGAMLRILYDAVFWGRRRPEGGRDRPLLIVLEEAHSYLGNQAKSRAATAARQAAKEGRKYGLGLMLVSQRPSEIDSTILSQCGTTVALRLTNEADRGHIRSCAADNLEGLFAMLPILRTGEALVVGEAVNLPVRAMVDLPPPGHRPDSDDPLVVTQPGPNGERKPRVGWTESLGAEDYAAVVKSWRTQDPTP